MTIGIAAICESGKYVVTASDRLITRGYPSVVEFETAERKAEALHRTCIVLQSANNLGVAAEIVDAARSKTEAVHRESLQALADLFKRAYTEIRLRHLEEEVILRYLGPDYVRHREKDVSLPDYLRNQTAIYLSLVQRMDQFEFGVQLLLAGIDGSGAPLFRSTHRACASRSTGLDTLPSAAGAFTR